MNHYTDYYHLYCIDRQCQVSIYKNMLPVRIPLTAKNLVASHSCTCCHQTLVSAVDLEISDMLASANSPTIKKTNYLSN
jgi:hypothetical protein